MGDAAAANLTRALDESLKHHAERLAANEETVAEQGRRQWEKIAQAQLQHVQSLAGVQNSLAQQAETMGRILQATGDVEQLQDVLNRNLAALAGAKNFEQTVLGLAAAIHLLNGRMVESASPHRPFNLNRNAAPRRQHESALADQEPPRAARGAAPLAVSLPRRADLHDGGAGALAALRSPARPACKPSREAAAKNAEKQSSIAAEMEMVQWRVDQLKKSRKETEAQLAEARLVLGHIEDHGRRLRDQFQELSRQAKKAADEGLKPGRFVAAGEEELRQIEGQIAEAQQRLAQAQQAAANRPKSYAIVPYDGPNHTRRRPIYIECRGDAVVLAAGKHRFQRGRFRRTAGPRQSAWPPPSARPASRCSCKAASIRKTRASRIRCCWSVRPALLLTIAPWPR